MTVRVTKTQVNHIVNQFKNRYIDFTEQKEFLPNHVVNAYLSWLYEQWNQGLIHIHEYRKLIQVDILSH